LKINSNFSFLKEKLSYPPLVLSILKTEVANKKKKRDEKYFQILEYFGVLLILTRFISKKRPEEFFKEQLGIKSDKLFEFVMQEFSHKLFREGKSAEYNGAEFQTKLMCYVCVLFLHLRDFSCKPSEISDDMKISEDS
jgi:hypothetical protein